MASHLIAPSILSADFSCLRKDIREAQMHGADWIHVDVMDGRFVPNLTLGPVIVEACRRITDLPLDVHLMVEEPEGLLHPFAAAGADHLTVHVEACKHLHATLTEIKRLGVKAGVVLNPATPAAAIREVIAMVDLVLVMSVNPGFSGGVYIPQVLDKVRTIREWIEAGPHSVRLEIDGGISAETIPQAAAAGADVFVAATSIFKHPQGIGAGIAALRAALENGSQV